jgi:protein-tyrosine phosphatase
MAYSRAEIHFHLLPGLDDGPATLADAVALAHAAALDGTSTIVATPHIRADYVTDVRELPDRVRAVKEALAREAVPVSVLPGGELGHDMVGRLRQDELEAIAQGPPRRRWLLLETPFEGLTHEFSAAADEVRDRGFGIVLAHPERSAGLLTEHRAGLDHELAAGSGLQVNAFSLLGEHGEGARETALRLLRLDVATAIASDAHGGVRAPGLTRVLDATPTKGIPPGMLRRLVDSAPRRLLARGLEPLPALR